MSPAVPLVALRGICKTFPGVTALDGVDLALHPGKIHALLGENGAGKSTLINILSGVLHPDAGQLFLRGGEIHLPGPQAAHALGIITVHQEADLFPDLGIAENIALEYGWELQGVRIDWHAERRHAVECLARFGSHLAPNLLTVGLSPAQRQVVGLGAALSENAALLILDEPTSSLSQAETDTLFSHLRTFRDAGGTVLYVSHRLEEVFALADVATVLRDGRHVWTGSLVETTPSQLIARMVGRELTQTTRHARTVQGPVRLACCGLTATDGSFRDVTLEVRAGEVVGLYGLIGAGRTEWALGLLGLEPIARGEVSLDGKPWLPRGPAAAAERGLVYLPEDRLRLGLFPNLSVLANLVLAVLRRLTFASVLSPVAERRIAQTQAERLAIRLRSVVQPVSTLSGGNQQKVVLGRWLACEPRTLILDEPTRGIDVAAKEAIHATLHQLADAGRAVVLISSDLPEVLAHSDRIGVFRKGQLVTILHASTATAEQVAHLAMPASGAREDGTGTAGDHGWRSLVLPRLREAGPLLAAVVIAVFLTLRTDTFFRAGTLTDVAEATALLTICGLGAALVILAGGIDISFGAIMALSAAVTGLLMREGWSPWLACPAGLVVGTFAGALNAVFSLLGRVHPIVVTLGTLSVYRGLTLLLIGSKAIYDVPGSFRAPWQLAPLGIPTGVWTALLLLTLIWWGLTQTVPGRQVYAQGSNPRAARRVGISHAKVWMGVFALQGLLAAGAGLQALATTASLQATDFEEVTLEAIGVAVVGGIAITGGRGSVWGILGSALLFRLLGKGWVLLHISGYWQRAVVGGMLLLAILADSCWRRRGTTSSPQVA